MIRVRTNAPLSLLMALVSIGGTQDASEFGKSGGSLCVASGPKPTDGEISLANPTGGGRSFNYSVQIDKGPVTAVLHEKGISISGLALKQKHAIKIRRDGKVVESFWFTFEGEGSERLCLWFKPLYETWSLWPAREAGKKCHCK